MWRLHASPNCLRSWGIPSEPCQDHPIMCNSCDPLLASIPRSTSHCGLRKPLNGVTMGRKIHDRHTRNLRNIWVLKVAAVSCSTLLSQDGLSCNSALLTPGYTSACAGKRLHMQLVSKPNRATPQAQCYIRYKATTGDVAGICSMQVSRQYSLQTLHPTAWGSSAASLRSAVATHLTFRIRLLRSLSQVATI